MLWSISPFVKSAYGIQAAQLTKLFTELGHDVTFLCYSGFKGHANFEGVPIIGVEDNGLSVLPKLSEGKDLVLAFFDLWTLPLAFDPSALIAYQPIDHSPMSFRIRMLLSKAKGSISMTRFHQQECEKVGIKSVYIPHFVNSEVFKPMDKKECRKAWGWDQDAFIVGINAANVGLRKNFEGMIDAFALAKKSCPDMKLALHTYLIRDYTHESGIDIINILGLHKLEEDKDWYVTDQQEYLIGLPDEAMATWYNGLDVLMLCSLGEGFGIPIVEAALCGKPSIVTDFAAAPEVAGVCSFIVPAEGSVYFPLNKTLLRRPEVKDIADALKLADYNRDNLKALGEGSLAHAKANYTKEVAAPMWEAYLSTLPIE